MGQPLPVRESRRSKSNGSSGTHRPPQAFVVPPRRLTLTVSNGGCTFALSSCGAVAAVSVSLAQSRLRVFALTKASCLQKEGLDLGSPQFEGKGDTGCSRTDDAHLAAEHRTGGEVARIAKQERRLPAKRARPTSTRRHTGRRVQRTSRREERQASDLRATEPDLLELWFARGFVHGSKVSSDVLRLRHSGYHRGHARDCGSELQAPGNDGLEGHAQRWGLGHQSARSQRLSSDDRDPPETASGITSAEGPGWQTLSSISRQSIPRMRSAIMASSSLRADTPQNLIVPSCRRRAIVSMTSSSSRTSGGGLCRRNRSSRSVLRRRRLEMHARAMYSGAYRRRVFRRPLKVVTRPPRPNLPQTDAEAFRSAGCPDEPASRGKDDPIPDVLDGASHDTLASSPPVHVRCIEEVDPGAEGQRQCLPGIPIGSPLPDRPQPGTSHPQARDQQARPAQGPSVDTDHDPRRSASDRSVSPADSGEFTRSKAPGHVVTKAMPLAPGNRIGAPSPALVGSVGHVVGVVHESVVRGGVIGAGATLRGPSSR